MRNNRPCFVWRFWSCQNSTLFTTTAASEREARSRLALAVSAAATGRQRQRLVFVARIRLEGIHHA
ncbi:host cell division inhibitor Icd-like protein [Salmonella enterica]|nr:host cell division inhibitor Icd-like protein [Salmonella enterica]EHI9909938.1 host cell division inhibitor Icd-like protein [Salmonella enterica]EHJ0910807.1 host cell division inhibitor Icd-like protein [Salmonella enterica]